MIFSTLLSMLVTLFKNFTINYPARYCSPSINVMLLKFYGAIMKLFGNQNALQNAKLIDSTMGVYRLTFWNGESWLMVNHARINRYVRGIEAAGLRLQRRYNLDVDQIKVDCFVDVGANVGEISFLYAKQGAKVICFEPDPNLREILQSNLSIFGKVYISTSALGNFTGPSEIMIATNTADTSLFPKSRDVQTAEVDVARYDQHRFHDLVEGTAILKMDTEGYEPEAIEGFGSEICKFSLIAVDCGLERGGASTAPDVEKQLLSARVFDVSVSKELIVNACRIQIG